MFEDTSKDFRTFFLLKFVGELIKNSGQKKTFMDQKEIIPGEISYEDITQKLKIQSIKKETIIKNEPEQRLKPQIRAREIKSVIPFNQSQNRYMNKNKNISLQFPEPILPPQLQYLHPTPTDTDIDLGRLDILIRDPAVRTIECRGPDEKLIVTGNMGIKSTSIVLNSDEINEVIERFSAKAKIPIHEGVFKVVVGKLILNAIISEVVNSKFLIKKMAYPQLNLQIPNR